MKKTLQNVVKFNINRYIDNGAFCPIDADEDTKEKFLRSIGVFHYQIIKTLQIIVRFMISRI